MHETDLFSMERRNCAERYSGLGDGFQNKPATGAFHLIAYAGRLLWPYHQSLKSIKCPYLGNVISRNRVMKCQCELFLT